MIIIQIFGSGLASSWGYNRICNHQSIGVQLILGAVPEISKVKKSVSHYFSLLKFSSSYVINVIECTLTFYFDSVLT